MPHSGQSNSLQYSEETRGSTGQEFVGILFPHGVLLKAISNHTAVGTTSGQWLLTGC